MEIDRRELLNLGAKGVAAGVASNALAGCRSGVPSPGIIISGSRTLELISNKAGRRFTVYSGDRSRSNKRNFSLAMQDWGGKTTDMDWDLLEYIGEIAAHTGDNTFLITSGYRTLARQRGLRTAAVNKDHVAKVGFHPRGQAADITMPNAGLTKLGLAALQTQRGGVGVYGDFVHIDTGTPMGSSRTPWTAQTRRLMASASRHSSRMALGMPVNLAHEPLGEDLDDCWVLDGKD